MGYAAKIDTNLSLPKLSPRQADTLIYLNGNIDEKLGCSPSYAEMRKDLDAGQGRVQDYLSKLIEKGYIERRDRGARRGLMVTERGRIAIKQIDDLVEEINHDWATPKKTKFLNSVRNA